MVISRRLFTCWGTFIVSGDCIAPLERWLRRPEAIVSRPRLPRPALQKRSVSHAVNFVACCRPSVHTNTGCQRSLGHIHRHIGLNNNLHIRERFVGCTRHTHHVLEVLLTLLLPNALFVPWASRRKVVNHFWRSGRVNSQQTKCRHLYSTTQQVTQHPVKSF